MRVLIDKYIPFLDGVLDGYAEVQHIAPEEFTPQSVRDADALVIRTRSRVYRGLLAGSKVRFVATATIGYDHIDTDYCRQQNITWTACPGCNAQAVCDYVEEALDTLNLQLSSNQPPTIGVVGYGHVGTLVTAMALRKGYRVLLSDPPLGIGVGPDEIAQNCNIITFHTPLTKHGPYPTYHLADEAFLSLCKPDVLLINAARGGVLDEHAVLRHKHTPQGQGMHLCIDCWEGEPAVNHALVQAADLASYHIAGYSLAGKMRASEMCLQALCRFFALPALSINKKAVPLQGDSSKGWLSRVSQQLKSHPDQFEQLRKQYKLR